MAPGRGNDSGVLPLPPASHASVVSATRCTLHGAGGGSPDLLSCAIATAGAATIAMIQRQPAKPRRLRGEGLVASINDIGFRVRHPPNHQFHARNTRNTRNTRGTGAFPGNPSACQRHNSHPAAAHRTITGTCHTRSS